MNYPAFLKKIDQLAAGCDAGSLRQFIHEIARTVPESDRQRFLDQLKHFSDDPDEAIKDESAPGYEELSGQIDRIIEVLNEINDGDRGLDSDYNEEWDDWNDYSRDEFLFSDPSGVLDDIGLAVSLLHAALDREEYEKGAELAQILSELTVPVSGEYDDTMDLRNLVNYDLLDIDMSQTVREAVYLAYMGTREPECAGAMLSIIYNFSDYSVRLEDILQMGQEEIDLDALLPSWIEELAASPDTKTDSLLTEALDMLQDKEAILDYASRYAESHPVIYQNILQKGLKDTSPEEMLKIGLQGMENVPVPHKTRSDISLLTAGYALKTQNIQSAENCWLEAFRSSPTVVNYLRLRLQSQCWEKYAQTAREIYMSYKGFKNQWDNRPLAVLMFFDAQFEEMKDKFMKPGNGLGWSSTFMKEGISLMLMLLNTGSADRPGMAAMRDKAFGACSFSVKEYCQGTDLISSASDKVFFQECFDKWKSTIVLPDNTCELWMKRIEQWTELRVSAIMGASRRNYYAECAAFIAAAGEVQDDMKHGSKNLLMQRYKASYSRRRAFHDELRRYGMK